MQNVIVTGGAGYIGAHIAKAARAWGLMPVVVDNLSTGHREAVQWGPLVECDILEQKRLEDVLDQYKPIGVFHAAALATVGACEADPMAGERTNVGGTVSLIGAMRRTGCNNLIFSSTGAVDSQTQYGINKTVAEKFVMDSGLDSIILRYCNVAGASPDGDIGERHHPETHLIPLLIEAALSGGEFNLYGTDYDTPDGTAVRDYVHVSDVADLNIKMLRHCGQFQFPIVHQVGRGYGVSVREVIAEVEEQTGKKIAVVEKPRRAGDVASIVSDNGYGVSHDVSSIVASAVKWHRRKS